MSHLWSGPHEAGYGTPCGRVTAREVIPGLDTGNPHTAAATNCTHAEFLAGSLPHVARSTLGADAFEQMLVVVRGAPDDPRFADELRELREVRAMLAGIRHDPTLAALLDDPRLIHGRWFNPLDPSLALPPPLAGRGHVCGAVQVGELPRRRRGSRTASVDRTCVTRGDDAGGAIGP